MKNKKETERKIKSHWKQFPPFSHNIFVYFIVIILLVAAIFILIYRYTGKNFTKLEDMVPSPSTLKAPPPKTPPAIKVPPIPPLEKTLALQDERLNNIENLVNLNLQIFHRLIALEILKAALDGKLALKDLILYLQKHPEPWTPPILEMLESIKQVKTYDQLQLSLIPPSKPPSHPLSLWQRMQDIAGNIISIRKIDKEQEKLDDILLALQEHDIKKAIIMFEKLSFGRQKQLRSWKKFAQDRLLLENLKLKMLLSITKT